MIYEAKPRCKWRARRIAWCRKFGKFCDAPREYEYCPGYEPLEHHLIMPFERVSRNLVLLRNSFLGTGPQLPPLAEVFPESLRLKPLFDMQDTLIEHKFPHEKSAIVDWIISCPGDIYRIMTHGYPDFAYVMEKWERLSSYATSPPLSRLQANDWEEIKEQITEPTYKERRDQYLGNLERLREETVKMPMDSKRQAVMIESLDMIKALIVWFESQDPYAPPRQQLHRLTDAVASYFPREFFEGSSVQILQGSPMHTYKFLIRTLAREEVAYEQVAKDSTEALEILAKRLDTTPATLFSVTAEIFEDSVCIWIAKPTPRPADFLFPEYVERKRKGLCPFCGRKIDCAEFRDEISRREYRISGLCQKCQDEVFRRTGVQIPPVMGTAMSSTLELKNRFGPELRQMISEAEGQKREVGVMLCQTPARDLRLSRVCWGRRATVTVADCHDGLSPLGSFHVHLGGTSIFSPADLELAIKKEQLSCLGYSQAGVYTLKCIMPKHYYELPAETKVSIKQSLDQAKQDIERATYLYKLSPTNPEAQSLGQRAQATLRSIEQFLDVYEVQL